MANKGETLDLSSQDFIAKLKDRNHDAIELLINKYHDSLFHAALKNKLGNDQAEEVVQMTWVTFFEKIENFEARSHVRTYLFGILYNKIKEQWRSNKKYTSANDEYIIEQQFTEFGQYLSAPKDPTQWLQNKEFYKILDEELQNLPENQRLTFFLKEIEGEETQDICNILGISNTNLGVLLYRAKNTLRLRLEKRLNK